MKYMGSKNRFAKYILPIILKDRQSNQWYVEPFCGGCNVIDKVDGNRIANDFHKDLIAMWKALQQGWMPPENVTEREYKEIQNNKENFPDYLVGYIGFNLSYAGKYWGGYGRDSIGLRNYGKEAYKNITKQMSFIKDIDFRYGSYLDLEIPDNSIVYCDPPYAETTKYKNKFDSDKFWGWATEQSKHHKVFVTEYHAPEDWVCVWEKENNYAIE